MASAFKSLFKIFLCLRFPAQFCWIFGAEDAALLTQGKDDKAKRGFGRSQNAGPLPASADCAAINSKICKWRVQKDFE